MRALIAASLLALLAGCAGSNFSYDNARQVRVGMTEAELTALMGRPYSVSARGDEQMWIWSRANAFTGSSRAVSFKLKDGRVIEVPSIPSSFK